MAKRYIRIIGLMLLGYGLTGLVISEIPGWVQFGWMEVMVALIAGIMAIWMSFRASFTTDMHRAARVYGVSSLGVASWELWGPFTRGMMIEPLELGLFAFLGILGLVVFFKHRQS